MKNQKVKRIIYSLKDLLTCKKTKSYLVRRSLKLEKEILPKLSLFSYKYSNYSCDPANCYTEKLVLVEYIFLFNTNERPSR